MKYELLPALLVLFLISVLAGVALADVDEYMGDAAIYSAQGTTGFKPNVLIIIDNSKATEHIASGEAYNSVKVYDNEGYNPWTIYVGDNQGAFNNDVFTSSYNSVSTALTDLPCTVGVVYNSLMGAGTYSGSGISDYPNLSNGGACATGPKGATYALGNYLNYVNATPETAGDIIVSHDYITRVGNSGNTRTEVGRKFLLTATHNSDSTNEPGTLSSDPDVLPAWQSYWQLLSTNDPRTAVPWASPVTYSLSASFVGQTQRQIVYDAVANVIDGARGAVNFAVMTYNDSNHGGKIVADMADLEDDGDFTTFLTHLPGSGVGSPTEEPVLSSNTARPQSEALYDAGYYFGATYSAISVTSRVPTSISKNCYNNIIFITNGLSNGDGGSSATIWQIGDADEDAWPGEADHASAVYGEGSHYLDDVAKYLQATYGLTTHMVLAFQGADALVQSAAIDGGGKFYNVYDANSLSKAMVELLTNIVAEVNSAFVAPVVPTSPENRTYSGERVYLGFFKPISQKPWQGNLKKFGINPQNQIIDVNYNVATATDGAFASTAVSWWNDVQDGGQVDQGGVGKVLKDRAADRKILTYNSSHTSKILTENEHKFVTTNTWITYNSLGVADDTEKDNLIKFIHGLDAYDDNGNGNVSEKRPWIMGDILHSKPKIVNYNSYNFNTTSENNCTWSGTDPYNKTVVYVGANDGMLHAFRDCDGEELWAFIPPDILADLKNLRGAGHRIFVDGTPTAYIYDADDDGNIESGDKVILIFGLRRGGGAYYALDVTDPEAPKWLWKIDSSNSDFAQLGQSWSTPTLGKIKFDAGGSDEDLIVAFIGAGYDNDNEDGRYGNTQGFTDADVVIPTADAGPKTSTGTTVLLRDGSAALSNSPKGRGVYAFKVATLDSSGVPTIATSPVNVWDFTYANSGTNAYNAKRLMYSIPADVAALDTDYDGYIDRLYAGDTGGQMWRISAYHPNSGTDAYRPYARAVINTTNDPWFGKIIFDANAATINSADKGRKIFYKPSVTLEKGGTYGVYFGTGDRAHPLNTAVTDRLYGLFDRGQKTSEEIDEDVLVNVTDNCLQDSSDTCVTSKLDALLTNTSKYGWYIKLNESGRDGEKVLADALAFNKVAYYTTYRPVATNANSCTPGNLGESSLYAVNYKTGEAVLNFDEDNDTQSTTGNTRALSKEGKVLRREDRSIRLGVGIPSGLVVLMPPSGDAQLLIGCGGGLCSEDPVAGGTIIPIYWMAW